MRFILRLLLTTSICTIHFSITGCCTMISCTDSLTCGGYQRYAWLRKRAYVARLAERKNYKAAMHRTFPLTSLADSLRMMPDLCSDYRSAGFLLNEASDHWPIRCVWSGGEMNGTCIPSPLYNASITYVSSSTWRELVRTFRMTIGCSQEDIEKADKVQELYICKERCIQAGIGKLPSMLIMSTLLLSIISLLFNP